MNTTRILFPFAALLALLAGLAGCDDDSPVRIEDPNVRPEIWRVPRDVPTIAAAADSALAGEAIEVAAGTYTEHGIVLQAGVDLRPAPGEKGTVIIDGEGLGRVLVVAPDTSRIAHTDTICELTDLTIRGGLSESAGGGLYAESTVVVTDCLITSNGSGGRGGGVFARGGTFLRCRFLANEAQGNGGGAYVGGDNPSFVHCRFDSNRCVLGEDGLVIGDGGGLHVGTDQLHFITVDSCRFVGNEASGIGGGARILGAAVVTDCDFTGNLAAMGGGAGTGNGAALVACRFVENEAVGDPGNPSSGWGGGLYDGSGAAGVTGCEFRGNRAENGSAFYSASSGSYVDCDFGGNVASGSGTARWGGSVAATMEHCRFYGNEANYGAAFHLSYGASAAFDSCTFNDNTARYAAGVGYVAYPNDVAVTVSMTDCRLLDNWAAGYGGALACDSAYSDSVTIELLHCLVGGNATGDRAGAFFVAVGADLTALNTTFADNTAPLYPLGFVGTGSAALFQCCDVEPAGIGGDGEVTIDDAGCVR